MKGKPLLTWHLNRFSAHCDQVAIVLGAHLEPHLALVRRDHPQVAVIINADWKTTHQVDSLRLALTTLRPTERVLMTLVDTPPAADQTLASLLAVKQGSAVPVDQRGNRGHPVLLDQQTIHTVIQDPLPEGLAPLLSAAAEILSDDPDVSIDFDTPNQWHQFISRWTT